MPLTTGMDMVVALVTDMAVAMTMAMAMAMTVAMAMAMAIAMIDINMDIAIANVIVSSHLHASSWFQHFLFYA